MPPSLYHSDQLTAVDTEITLPPIPSVATGDIVIVGVTGGLGTVVASPDVSAFSGGPFHTTFSNDEIIVITIGDDLTLPAWTWEYSSTSELAAVCAVYRGGFIRDANSAESATTAPATPTPFYGNPSDCIIAFVAAGPCDGPSGWIQLDSTLYGFSNDSGGSVIFGQVARASEPELDSEPPTVTGNLISTSRADGTYRADTIYINGGNPDVSLAVSVSIDSTDSPGGDGDGDGWHVGAVGWGGAWSA